ncbi:MAG: hypothetical protein ACUVQY_06000 [Thermoproteota archaeon]
MSQSFLERLRDYLNERLRDEGPYKNYFKPFEIWIAGPSSMDKWSVGTQGVAVVGSVTESIDGTVGVGSCLTDKAGVYISERLVKSYRHRLRKARAKGKEEEEKVWKALDKEEEEIREDYINRRNIEKHLKKNYKNAFIRLLWFDEAARRTSKEFGVEVKVGIDEIDCDSGLVSEFNGSNMSEEEKFEEIKRRVEAVIAAYRLAHYAYKTPYFTPELQEEGHKKYLEFRKALLEKYMPKGIKKAS